MDRISNLDAYKLETKFYDDRVVHKTYTWELSTKVQRSSSWVNIKRIGSGGFGAVWLEKEEESGQLRAVKKLNRETLPSTGFSRELLALIRLEDHQHLFVKFFGWYENRRVIYIAMEYLHYGDLSEYIKDHQKGRIEAKEITRQILEGLKVLHEEGICHRDLKPQNVLVACQYPVWVKIADFGASKRTRGTALWTRVGTEGYLAPELIGALPRKLRGAEELTHALDIWSLGCLVHELLTSQTPFLEGDTPDEDPESGFSKRDVLSEPALDMNTFFAYCGNLVSFPIEVLQKSEASDEAVNFVKRLLAPNPTDRLTAAAALEDQWITNDSYVSDWHASLESEFSILEDALGIDLSLNRHRKELLMRKIHRADVMELLPSSTRENYSALLQHAVTAGLSRAVTKLLQSSLVASVSRSTWGQILYRGSEHDQIDTVGLILSRVDVCVDTIFEGQTGLQVAARSGYFEMVNLFVAHNASVNIEMEPNGQTVLQAVAQDGNMDMVKLLLGHGANVNARADFKNSRTALQTAAGAGHMDMAQMLITHGADVNAEPCRDRGLTALQAAAGAGHMDMAQMLLTHGADVNAGPGLYNGLTALQAAAGAGHMDMAQMLLTHGADVNAGPGLYNGLTALQAAAGAGHMDMAQMLLTRGADVNAEPSFYKGQTALQAAAGARHMDIAQMLLTRGADVNANPSNSGRTALQAAAGAGHMDMAQMLLTHGAGVNARPGLYNGLTALQAAAGAGHMDMAQMLLTHGADVNAGPSFSHGLTALQAAAGAGHMDMAQMLITHGADVNARPGNSSSRTALQAAAGAGHMEMAQMLRKYGAY